MTITSRFPIPKDLNKARKVLEESSASLVVVHDHQTWQRFGRGIKPLYELLTEEGLRLKDGALADKVMGKAAALLILHAGIKSAYAKVISKPAYELLVDNNVLVTYDVIVEHILNRAQTGFCPMELLTSNITLPSEAYTIIGRQLQEWES